jgi:hypothetical protein
MREKRPTGKMSMKEMLDNVQDYCEPAAAFTIAWGKKGRGWGQLYFYVSADKSVHCSNEMMSKEFIKEILCKMVDDMKLDDPPFIAYRESKGPDE